MRARQKGLLSLCPPSSCLGICESLVESSSKLILGSIKTGRGIGILDCGAIVAVPSGKLPIVDIKGQRLIIFGMLKGMPALRDGLGMKLSAINRTFGIDAAIGTDQQGTSRIRGKQIVHGQFGGAADMLVKSGKDIILLGIREPSLDEIRYREDLNRESTDREVTTNAAPLSTIERDAKTIDDLGSMILEYVHGVAMRGYEIAGMLRSCKSGNQGGGGIIHSVPNVGGERPA